MNLPKFLIGDNTDHPEDIFIIHTEFPQFIINLVDDEIEWLEDLSGENEAELTSEMNNLIKLASRFYDREMDRYEKT
jgi:hypothetical protein